MTKYIFVTGGVVSGLGKGITAACAGSASQNARAQGRGAEARPLHQRRPRHDEPVSARRGLRDRRRRGDRPRPRPLRALHRRRPQQILEPHNRQGLLERARTRSAGASISARPCRSSRTLQMKSRISSTASARRPNADVVITEIGGTIGDIESQPLHRGGSADLPRSRAGEQPLYPCDAGAVSAWLRRAQVQAHAALRQGAAGHGHQPRISSCSAATSRSKTLTSSSKISDVLQRKAATASSRT